MSSPASQTSCEERVTRASCLPWDLDSRRENPGRASKTRPSAVSHQNKMYTSSVPVFSVTALDKYFRWVMKTSSACHTPAMNLGAYRNYKDVTWT
ncbi:hypothetical protein ElyMa_005998600 [Elysia marginata]|uniref:Uncharacterized protein n=1 Tax=Elysia marginata TaxID=1093978 RepID=A0AAV4GGE0_9GAST|nr:hypothetical protein ElyMa_005998600 [Elysia marginata]